MMEGANDGPQKFWPEYNTEFWFQGTYIDLSLGHSYMDVKNCLFYLF